VAVGFGVLTVSEEAHAHARAAPGPGNKGAEAARAAVVTARLLQSLRAAPTRARRAPARRGRPPARPRGKIV